MREGREGPVVLDIPHNVQGSQIDVETLVHFHTNVFIQTEIVEYDMIKHVADCIMHSKRPVLLLGGGCRGLKGDTLLHEFIQKIKIPVVSSYRGKDVFDNNDMFYLGTIGAVSYTHLHHFLVSQLFRNVLFVSLWFDIGYICNSKMHLC